MSVTTLVKNSCSTVGEGPHWDEKTQRLLYVDIMAGDVHIYDPVTQKDEKKHFGKCAHSVLSCASFINHMTSCIAHNAPLSNTSHRHKTQQEIW